MVGAALVVLGGAVFLRGLSAPTKGEVLKVGDGPAIVEERSPIAPWATGLAVLVGLALVATGRRRKAVKPRGALFVEPPEQS
jgi:hypothetical protein